jgi:hypothetical protein
MECKQHLGQPLLVIASCLCATLGVRAQQVRITQTDSSRLETRLYPGGREEKEFLRAKDRVYWRFYQGNTRQVTVTATRTKAGREIGRWTEYDTQGKLRYVVDRDRGTWWVAQRTEYPFFRLQQHVKAQADCLLVATYGRYFLTHHTSWNVQSSAIYNATESGNWTDQFAAPPTKFLVRYDVKLDAQQVYPELIEFELDAQGHLLPNSDEQVYGLGQQPLRGGDRFRLRYEEALKLVKRERGAHKPPLTGFLKWESFKQPNFYSGQFRFYVPLQTGSHQELHPAGRSSITDHFDVYAFDPWTGVLLEKKKMKTVRSWEKLSGSSSGFLPE